MNRYALIGNPVAHSASARLFGSLFDRQHLDACYELCRLDDIGELRYLIAAHDDWRGMNVTLPFKRAVIPLLDHVDSTALMVGAVNVIRLERKAGGGYRLEGFNTDLIGFRESLRPHLQSRHTQALILGTGGASAAVACALKELGIAATHVSRTPVEGQLAYGELTAGMVNAHKLIVNATPVGMSPQEEQCPPIPYEGIGREHLLYDLVYNPRLTRFLQLGRQRGALTLGGYDMFLRQARAAWQIWNPEGSALDFPESEPY